MMIDLRSDTLTKPTPAMRQAMADAEVGDDVYGEDPTVNRLEQAAARWLGKEAALFVPSGTMGNQLAVMSHCQPAEQVLLDRRAHLYWNEVGSIARLSACQPWPIDSPDGVLTPQLVQGALRGGDIHWPTTRLVAIENTHNMAGGRVMSVEQTRAIGEFVHAQGLLLHLDGARLANAAVALGVPVHELAQPVDSVMCCLSKGLGAPVGSVLAGSRAFIARARKNRKALGGGMRQAGILAAAGLVAIEEMVERLADDHRLAKEIAVELAQLPGLGVDVDGVETNMVMVRCERPSTQMIEALRGAGLLCSSIGPTTLRLVTHVDVAGVSAQQVADCFARALAEVA